MLNSAATTIKRVGRGPLRLSPEWLLLSLLLIGGILFAMQAQWLWRIDQLFYDIQLKTWSRAAPDDMVIVAVDSASLSTYGRWPWPRSLHADLIDRLSEQGARAIFMDILFVEPERRDPQGDARLAQALASSGRVYLPVIIEQQFDRLVETLPMPTLREQAKGLGHVDIDLDPDGIARRVFLREGLGEARWPSIAVSILRGMEPSILASLPGGRNPATASTGPQTIVRDNHVLIPFAGPPGHFHRISYQDVLQGRYAADTFDNKIVLVGATAPGLGDLLPTPLSGYNRPMSGVEINANLIDALRRGITIESLGQALQLQINGVILFLAFLSFPLLKPKVVLPVLSIVALMTLGMSALLLHGLHIWYPPTAILIGLLLGFPLWSWRRMVRTVHYFEQELTRLRAEPRGIGFAEIPAEISRGLDFLQAILQLEGWILLDAGGAVLQRNGWQAPPTAPILPVPAEPLIQQQRLWIRIPRGDSYWQLGVETAQERVADEPSLQLLVDYTQQFAVTYLPERRGNVELVERQVRRVQTAIADLRAVRRLLSDILRQMVDGMLVINLGGEVVMHNEQAVRLLGLQDETDLAAQDMLSLASQLEIKQEGGLAEAFRQVLVEGENASLEGRIPQGSELLIQLSPLSAAGGHFNGAIIILSDITRLKESERARTQTLNFLSHDLRSPLTSMISMLEIQRSGVGQMDMAEMTERIEQYALKALKLADDFLRLAKAESADYDNFQEVDLVSVAHSALDAVFAEAQEKSIRLLRNRLLEQAWIKADGALLERCLINLLENAIRYSPEGSTVALQMEAGEGTVRCLVIDQGPGIAEADQARIFAPFQQVRKSDDTSGKGTGLGLAFVKVVAAKHRGQISVESEIDGGARFCLSLPFDQDEPL
ncbi:CHASE2 domain-containing protein [Sedimenticola sp.]|uniref:CHASE2 domain-containing protein n=1 Tax=Sedimenticola sp. TaxID=1940285 RepID=UPI003D0D2A88